MMDMCLFPRTAYRAARDIGIRAVIAPYVADTKPFTPTLAQTEALLKQTAADDDRVRTFVGLHDLESCSDEQISAGVALAKQYATGFIFIAPRQNGRSTAPDPEPDGRLSRN